MDPKVRQITEMGVASAEQALRALQLSDGDVHVAVEHILSGQSGSGGGAATQILALGAGSAAVVTANASFQQTDRGTHLAAATEVVKGIDAAASPVSSDAELAAASDAEKVANVQDLLQYATTLHLSAAEDMDAVLRAAAQIRILVSSSSTRVRALSTARIQRVIDTGCVPRLVELMREEGARPALQLQAVWAIANVATGGSSAHLRAIIDAGAVPVLCEHLSSSLLRAHAAAAISNIALDSVDTRDAVIAAGVLPPLLQMLRDDAMEIHILRTAVSALKNVCSGKPQPPLDVLYDPLRALAEVIAAADDEDVLCDACWAVSYVADGPNDRIQAVMETGIDTGALPRVLELLGHVSTRVQTAALRTAGNLVTGDDLQTQIVLDNGLLPGLLSMLGSVCPADHAPGASRQTNLAKEALWTLSNIAAGTAQQIQALLDSNLLLPTFDFLSDEDATLRKEAAWVVSNVCAGGTYDQIMGMVQQGCIGAFCDLLETEEDDPRLITVALEGLENILKANRPGGGAPHGQANEMVRLLDEQAGLVMIDGLQQHPNFDGVARQAARMVSSYFPDFRSGEYNTSRAVTAVPSAEQVAKDDVQPTSSATAVATPPAAPASVDGALAGAIRGHGGGGDGSGGDSSSSSSSSDDDDDDEG
jgi:hypothetical protein